MAPARTVALARRPVATRTQQKLSVLGENVQNFMPPTGKRKADASPVRNEKTVKRAALGNVTNAVLNAFDDDKKLVNRTKSGTAKKLGLAQAIIDENVKDTLFNAAVKVTRESKIVTRASTRAVVDTAKFFDANANISTNTTRKPRSNKANVKLESDKENVKNGQKDRRHSRRQSCEHQSNEDSHYLSALEELTNSRLADESSIAPIPDGVNDFDLENWNDPCQASEYAMDIFKYLKKRETDYIVDSYMDRQPQLSPWMRTLLVDWMVEVQETFELNHETLYLGVKIVDIYLSKVTISKEFLQLLGAAAMLIACKYDERIPIAMADFLYFCDGAYKRKQLVRMEMEAFRVIGFDLGIPLSYRFLRRYARCAKVTMPELTLARFILEFSLMNYDLVAVSDSKLAAACLFMALRMNKKTGWNKTLQYYSGYKLDDFKEIVPMLNDPLHRKQFDANKTIRNKYTHKLFYEVSKTALITNEQLFDQSELIETI